MVGNIRPVKNYDIAIKTISLIKQAGYYPRLVIFGSPSPAPNNLVRLIEEYDLSLNVEFYGYCVNPISMFNDFYAYLQASSYEGMPNSLVQALSAGLQVVSTDCSTGPYEILEAGKYGLLVPVGNASAAANALISVYNTPIQASRTEVLKKYTANNVADSYSSYLASLN
jgi:glycosyltransferase involved in cell wall biosynthesis